MRAPAVAISSMHIINAPCRADGARLLASFDAEFTNFKFVGCSLMADPTGETHAYPPDARWRTQHGRPIVITNPTLRQTMLSKAVKVYATMTGQDGAA